MTTIKASVIEAALGKAKNIGRVEDTFELDGCRLTLQNLTADEFMEISDEIKDLEEVEYLVGYQVGNVSRAVVQINDLDLRGVEFIEIEVPTADGEEPRKIPRHEWVLNNVFSSWGREALTICWRKFAELLEKAEEKAKEGIVFTHPEEDSETRLRRAMNDLQEAEEELAPELASKILEEAGLFRGSNRQELERAAEQVSNIEVATSPEPPGQAVSPILAPSAPPRLETAQNSMSERQPLNRVPVQVPEPPREPEPVRAGPVVSVPTAVRQAALNNTAKLSRSEQIAQLEASGPVPLQPVAIDQQQVASITEQPPLGGINPRYKRP